MRANEFITEVFDKGYFRIRWDEKSGAEWDGGFTASDGSIIHIFFMLMDNDYTWHVEWSRNSTQDRIATPPKLAIKILSTINAALKQFIRKEQPVSIIVGVTNNDVKKLEVYHKMLGALNYHWEKMSRQEIRKYNLKPNNLWYRYWMGSDEDDEEFLVEYNRQITVNKVGPKLLPALIRDRSISFNTPEIEQIIDIAKDLARNNTQPSQAGINAITNAVLAEIESRDPTQNKIYTPWLATVYSKGGLNLEDINRNNLLTIFDIGKRRRMIKPEHADINRFKTYGDFEDVLIRDYDLDAIEGGKKKKEEEKGKAKKVYEDGNVLVVVPEDEAAACRYGRGTRWCTAATQGDNYFAQYNRQGPLYILIPKNPKHEGEKYQLHFPSSQFMDEDDSEVEIVDLLTERFPGLLEFFKENEPELKDMILFADDSVLQPLLDKIAELAEEHLWEILSDWESNDDYYFKYLRDEGYEDENGDIDWDRVVKGRDTYENYNDEYRRFSNDMQDAIRPTIKTIRGLLNLGFDLEKTTPVSLLPQVVAVNVKNIFPKRRGDYDGGMADYILRNIDVERIDDES
jgi:hypothetical protein